MTVYSLHIPGRVHRVLCEMAENRLVVPDDELDVALCDKISRATLKRRGRGWTATLTLTLDQAERLVDWTAVSRLREVSDLSFNLSEAVIRERKVAA